MSAPGARKGGEGKQVGNYGSKYRSCTLSDFLIDFVIFVVELLNLIVLVLIL